MDPSCLANLQISLETDGNGGTSSGYFVTGLVSSTTQLRNVGSGSECAWELGKRSRIAERRTKALYVSLAMVCKSEALDVVKTVTHKRGFESWRQLCKEYGSTNGTSLHEYTNLLEKGFGTTDGFKKNWLKWEDSDC